MLRHVSLFLGLWHVGFFPPYFFLYLIGGYPTQAGTVLRGLSAAVDGVKAASSSAGMPSRATALFTRAMGRKRPRASSSCT
jgi:hypothetical protein